MKKGITNAYIPNVLSRRQHYQLKPKHPLRERAEDKKSKYPWRHVAFFLFGEVLLKMMTGALKITSG